MNGNSTHNKSIKEAFEGFEVQPAPEMLDNILGRGFDSSIQAVLKDFATAPRPQVWEQISEVLPTENDKVVSKSFQSFKAVPPAGMWATIQSELPIESDKVISKSFESFEVAPPTEMWATIQSELGVESDKVISNSFESFEVVPSAGIWAAIQGELDVENDKVISKSFESFEAAPSAGMWAAIHGELDVAENFDAKFHSAFDDFEAVPSSHVLENIFNNKFDTGVRRSFMRHEIQPDEAVWQRIRKLIPFSPALRRQLHTLRKVAAIIALLLMFNFLYDQYNIRQGDDSPTLVEDTPNQPTIVDIPTETTVQNNSESDQTLRSVPEEVSTGITSVKKQPVTREVDRQRGGVDYISQPSSVGSGSNRSYSNGASLPPVFNSRGTEINSNSNSKPLITPPITIERKTPSSSLISSIQTLKVNELDSDIPTIRPSINFINNYLELLEVSSALRGSGKEFSAPTIQSNLVDMNEDTDLGRMMLSYKGFYITSSFSLYNSWIVNDEIRQGMIDKYSVDYVVDLGRSFGLGGGYQFSPKFGIEAEFVSGRLSQNYRELTSLNASNSGGNSNTSYYYIPLSIKYQTHRLNSMNKRIPMTASVVLGAHYGKLQNSNINSIAGRELAPGIEDSFIQQEVGAFMGADYHLYLHPNTHFTIGARAAAGTDVDYLSAPFAKGTPYNLQFGMRVGLSYRFASKKYKWRHGIY